MTSKDFWWGVVFFGSIVQPILRWFIKKFWLWFVHRSAVTVRIWWGYKKAHAERTIERADEFLADRMP